MSEEATFRIASITKTFTAAAVLRLHEEHALDIDCSIERYLERAVVRRLEPLNGSAVTVRHLLQHRAGFASWISDAEFIELLEPGVPYPFQTAAEQVEAAIGRMHNLDPPGTVVRYSDTGFILASMIIEAVASESLPDAFRSLLAFDDLGLPVIHLEALERTASAAGPRCRQYWGERDLTDADHAFDRFGNGGLISDASDLCRFWHALFMGQVFHDAATLEEMCRTVPEPGAGREVGLGILQRESGGLHVFYHSGGWGSFAIHVPTARVTVAGSTNQAIEALPPGAWSGLRNDLVSTFTS